MIRLDNYGYCLEEYAYDMQDNKVKEISYILHNEKGQDCAVVGVCKLNGKPTRSVVLWPHSNPKDNDNMLVNEEIPEMRLYLDCIDQKFNFDDIEIFSYNSSIEKDTNGFTTIFNLGSGRHDIGVYTDKNNIMVYNKISNIVKIYKSTENGEIDYNSHIESIRLTDFGTITERMEDHTISTFVSQHNKYYSKEYEYIKTKDPIESLQLLALSLTLDNKDTYKIFYDNDHMIQRVLLNEDIFSRSETEEIIFKSHGKVGQITDSIYPTLITDNYQNYKYEFMKLWTHDKMRKNEKDEVIFFQRKIYMLKDYNNLLEELRKNTNKLYINR